MRQQERMGNARQTAKKELVSAPPKAGLMRTLLIVSILIGQLVSVQAGCKSPVMRRLSAITRYCFVTAESQRAKANKCEYDCLISKEVLPLPANRICPIAVRLRLYCDHTSEIVPN
jgi:hypothetical protein